MREILFRGKRKNNGEWVEGSYAVARDRKGLRQHNILVADNDLGYFRWHVIDETTLCQYTGLTDKNGNKIWENDIVGYQSLYNGEWYFATVSYGEFNCSCCNGVWGWTFENGDIRDYERYEVKGNIFDNPEPYKGE